MKKEFDFENGFDLPDSFEEDKAKESVSEKKESSSEDSGNTRRDSGRSRKGRRKNTINPKRIKRVSLILPEECISKLMDIQYKVSKQESLDSILSINATIQYMIEHYLDKI